MSPAGQAHHRARHTDLQVDAVRRLRAAGQSYRSIAAAVGVPPRTARDILAGVIRSRSGVFVDSDYDNNVDFDYHNNHSARVSGRNHLRLGMLASLDLDSGGRAFHVAADVLAAGAVRLRDDGGDAKGTSAGGSL